MDPWMVTLEMCPIHKGIQLRTKEILVQICNIFVTVNLRSYIFFNFRMLPVNTFNNVIPILIGLVCVIFLLLPSQKEVPQPSNIPEYLHVSFNLKLVLSYVLGLVTMVIFRPWYCDFKTFIDVVQWICNGSLFILKYKRNF